MFASDLFSFLSIRSPWGRWQLLSGRVGWPFLAWRNDKSVGHGTAFERLVRGTPKMSTGENLLHILNTLESRATVLEAELREIDEDIALNANMARKYGDEFFTEGSARLMQTRVDKQQRLAEISTQLQQTGQSVQQGKQLLGSLMDNYGHPVPPSRMPPLCTLVATHSLSCELT